MSLVVHRSQRVEALVDALVRELRGSWPADPFEAVPVLVGSRGMDRWLRHELATRLGGVARVDFVFPGAAFEGAARWLAGRPARGDRTPFWQRPPSGADPWSGAHLVARVLSALRDRLETPAFARVRGYLGEVAGPVRARELAFAGEVARTIERLCGDRPEDAVAWVREPAAAGEEHRFLAEILAALHGEAGGSPAHAWQAAAAVGPLGVDRALHVFGLTTLRPGDKRWLGTIARHLPVHLYALAPSSAWWGDIDKLRERRARLRDAARPGELEAVLADIERQNALLAADGGPSRDLQQWIEETSCDARDVVEPPREPPATLLAEVQAWVDAAGDNPPPGAWAAHAGCASLEVHACHGPLRQCEALRDELLRRFAADPTLEPRHVLVMTPDVATHAPLLAAVFARHGDAVPPIPLHVADLGLRAENPVADAIVQLLGLADERVTASRLVDLLASTPVRRRFGIADDDVAAVRDMIVGSGMRWAWDARDRARHHQPAIDQNTLRFGLERLALGVLMHDPGGLAVVPAGGEGLGPAVPLEVAGRDDVERFGRLAELCDRLASVRARVVEPASAAAWRDRLRALLDDFTEVDADEAWLRVEVDDALGDLLPDAMGIDLDRSAVVDLLRGAFDRPMRGDRPITGAVTVCALEPMRSVPFRVIAILGLDDQVFPRPSRAPAWDPFATPRPGEYDRRTIDRHLFLEAVLCARDALLLFGTGYEPKRGAHAPMSVVVSELAEVLAPAVGLGHAEALRVAHPLQPWSEDAFHARARRTPDDPVGPRAPFDGAWAAAAEALRGERRWAGLPATPLDAEWPPESVATTTVTADELARALARPQEELLRRRLGIALAAEDATVPDREPLEHETLDAWALRDRVLEATSGDASPGVDDLEARLRGEGVLELRAGGRRTLEKLLDEARATHERAAEVPGVPADPVHVTAAVDGLVVTASATDVRRDGDARRAVWTTASSAPNPRMELAAWVTLLVAAVAGDPIASAHLCGHREATRLHAPDPGEARACLEALVGAWRRVRRGPVRLFPRLSRAVARAIAKDPGVAPADAVLGCDDAWSGSAKLDGDQGDPWVGALFGALAIDDLAELADEVCREATGVWGPIVAARDDGAKARRA